MLPVLLRDMAGETALPSLEGPLLIGLLTGLEGGRLLAGDAPLEGMLDLSGLLGALLRSGLHASSAFSSRQSGADALKARLHFTVVLPYSLSS